MDALLTLLNALVVDQADQPADVHETEDFAEEQNCIARLVPLMHADSVDEQYQMLSVARRHFGTGGKYRLKYTLPSIVFASYELIRRITQLVDTEPDSAEVSHNAAFVDNKHPGTLHADHKNVQVRFEIH